MSQNAGDTIQVEHSDGVTLVRMNRPEKKNALTAAMYVALVAAFAEAEADPACRALLITGSPECFTSGNDVTDFMSAPPTDESSPVVQFLLALHRFPKPLIAAVSGPAIGIGSTLLLHCDLVYADATAIFRMPFVQLGLCPEAGSSLLLPLQAGYHRAAEILLLGEKFDAQSAAAIGLVNEAVAAGAALSTAQAKARQLALLPAAALRASKALLRKPQEAERRRVIEEECRIFVERLASPEFAEAAQAMIERREPDFTKFA